MILSSSALLVVGIYFALLLGAGYYANRFLVKNSSDYLLAGRSLPAILIACSLAANNIGGGSTIGIVGKSYGQWGMSAVWYVLAACIGIIPMYFFASRLRSMMAYTIPEIIGRKYGPASHIITALLHISALFCLTASQILASGIIISALTGIPVAYGILLAGIFTIAYTVMGGLWADAFTDIFQWVVILIGLSLALPYVLNGAGGWEAIKNAVPPEKMAFSGMGAGTIASLVIMYFITFMSGPEMVTRIYAAKDEKSAGKAIIISAVLMAVFAFIPAVLGIIAFSVFPGIEPQQALPKLMLNYAPVWVTGMVCAAIIAATMSSADTDMLCASTIIVKDIYQKYINPDVTDRNITRITRISNVVIGLAAVSIALFKINIITLNIFSFMLRSAGPFAAFVFGLYMKNPSRISALSSIITGSAAAVIWKLAGSPLGILPVVTGTFSGITVFLLSEFFSHLKKRQKKYQPEII